MIRSSKPTLTSKKMVWLSAVLALPPLFLATALIGTPAPQLDNVPAVAGYNEAPADASRAKPKALAQLLALLRTDDNPKH